MLTQKEHKIKRIREIATEISSATEENLTQNPDWFDELIELYNETLKPKPKQKCNSSIGWPDARSYYDK
jgi:hypothetical protein